MNHKFFLILICLLFLFTRLYKISEIPVSVYWDEASIGYNSYSISTDLKDEWGEFLPLHFRAFGEFKLPVYIYSVVPFVKIFGLNAISVRLPSVLFSLGVVVLTYLLAKKLSGSIQIGLWSSFFITISPWFFIFSRTGYEATAGLMFYLSGIYLFLFTKKNWHIFFSVLSFVVSIYSYNSFRIIAPITILLLCIVEWSNLKKAKVTPIILSLLFLGLSVIPIYRLYKYDSGSSRFQAVATTPQAFIKNYLSHFNPGFLFISGDKNLRSQQSDFGQLYYPETIFLAAGLIYILKIKSKYSWLPLLFLISAPLPAAITKESPHGLRALAAVPFICMIVAMGAVYISQIKKNIILPFIILLFLGLFTNYFLNFLNIYPIQSAKDWQYDYKKIFTNPAFQAEIKNKIFIPDKDGQPYIFALFYLKYDPEKFRKEVIRNSVDKWGFSTVKSFGMFEFGNK